MGSGRCFAGFSIRDANLGFSRQREDIVAKEGRRWELNPGRVNEELNEHVSPKPKAQHHDW